MKQAGFDERLTFYGLQAHFFSVDAQVVHWRIAKIHKSGNKTPRMVESAVDIREQSQKALGHAQSSAQYGRESDPGLDHRTRESADWRLLYSTI